MGRKFSRVQARRSGGFTAKLPVGPALAVGEKRDPLRIPGHVANGYPHFSRGTGFCMCERRCCAGSAGCVCRDCPCQGQGHETTKHEFGQCTACDAPTGKKLYGVWLCTNCRVEFESELERSGS